MANKNIPPIGRPFSNEITENQLKALFQASANSSSIETTWPLMVKNTAAGGIRLWIDPKAFEQQQQASSAETTWPVIVREVRDDNDHFIMIQDVNRDDADPWVGGMKSIGEAYEAPIWGHHVARDFRPFITRQTELDRFVTILPAIIAIGQVWVMQYLRHDLVQPSTRVRYTDCISALTKDT